MKKLVLVVAMFMFVCGGSFLVKAQNSAEAATALAEVNATAIVNDTVVKDTVTKSEERPLLFAYMYELRYDTILEMVT